MSKKLLRLFLCLLLTLPLAGCWNYRSLSDMCIVEGIGVDFDDAGGAYRLSFEIIDMSSPVKSSGIKTKIVESEGKTLFDAVRNAKKRLNNRLYFGNAQTVIISNSIASQQGLSPVIDLFVRDAECRESLNVVISLLPTAKALLSASGTDQPVVSQLIQNIVDKDEQTTGSTRDLELYRIYNILHAKDGGQQLVVPTFHVVPNDGTPVVEARGLSVFKKDKLLGYLSAQEAKYFLFITGKIKGGILPASISGSGPENVSLEIMSSRTKRTFSYEEGKLTFTVKTDTETILSEMMQPVNISDEKTLKALEKSIESQLRARIENLIKKVQADFGSDIFGFGNELYQKDFKLWKQLRENWETDFPKLEVTVEPRIRIVGSSTTLKS